MYMSVATVYTCTYTLYIYYSHVYVHVCTFVHVLYILVDMKGLEGTCDFVAEYFLTNRVV